MFHGVGSLAWTGVPKLLFPLGASSPGQPARESFVWPPSPSFSFLASLLTTDFFPRGSIRPPRSSSEGTRAPMVISRVYDTRSLFRRIFWPRGPTRDRSRLEGRRGPRRKRLHGVYRCLRGEINDVGGAVAAAIGVRLFRITLAPFNGVLKCRIKIDASLLEGGRRDPRRTHNSLSPQKNISPRDFGFASGVRFCTPLLVHQATRELFCRAGSLIAEST